MNSKALMLTAVLAATCATTAPTRVAPEETTTATAEPRSDCPPHYQMFTNENGTACAPAGRQVSPSCKPYRCPESGYLLWDCETPKQAYRRLRPEPGLTPEQETTLRAELETCRRYEKLGHHAAEVRALENQAASRALPPDSNQLYRSCRETLLEMAELESDIKRDFDPPVGCSSETFRMLSAADAKLTPALQAQLQCQAKITEHLQKLVEKLKAHSRYAELLPVHNSCVKAFKLDERFFAAHELECSLIAEVLARQEALQEGGR